jgi:hypothetical protein
VRQTGHGQPPCPATQRHPRPHGGHYSCPRLPPLSLDVYFLPQLLSLLSPFNRPTKLYHNQYIRRLPPAQGPCPVACPRRRRCLPRNAPGQSIDVASMGVVSISKADRSALSAAIPPPARPWRLCLCSHRARHRRLNRRAPRRQLDRSPHFRILHVRRLSVRRLAHQTSHARHQLRPQVRRAATAAEAGVQMCPDG